MLTHGQARAAELTTRTATVHRRTRSTAAACGSPRRSPRRRWTPPSRACAQVRPEGIQRQVPAHRRWPASSVGTGARARHLRRPGLPRQSQINWATPAAWPARRSSRSRWPRAQGRASRSRTPSTATRRSCFDDGLEIRNEGEARHDYGSAVNLLKATRGLDQHRVHRPDDVACRTGRRRSCRHDERDGHPAGQSPTRKYPRLPERHRRTSTPYPLITLGSATSQPDQHGQRLRHHRQRRPVPDVAHHRQGRVDSDGEVLYDHSVSDKQAIDGDQAPDIAADVSYAMQQVVQNGTGTAALGGRPPRRRQDRHRHQRRRPGRLGVVRRLHARSCPPSVMYVRGKGNEQLDGWLPSYFGGRTTPGRRRPGPRS